jgi:hypothetical protein
VSLEADACALLKLIARGGLGGKHAQGAAKALLESYGIEWRADPGTTPMVKNDKGEWVRDD